MLSTNTPSSTRRAQTAWGQSIVDGSNGYVAHVKSDRAYNLADGVDVLEMAFLADDGLAMQMFLFRIALSDKITLRTTLANDKDAVGTGQTIMKQLEAMQKNGKRVLGGTNADFFNTTTYIPYGVCYRDGVAVKTSFNRTDCNVFVISKDNTAYCFTAEEYALDKDIVREAVCGRSAAAAEERRAAGPERQHDAGGEHGTAHRNRRVAGRQGGLPDGGRRP